MGNNIYSALSVSVGRAKCVLCKVVIYLFSLSAVQSLLDSRSLKFIVGLTLQDRTNKTLLRLQKKKKTPSISAQFQVTSHQLSLAVPDDLDQNP